MSKRFSRLSAVLAIGLVLTASDASAQFGFSFGGGGFGGGGFGGFGRGGGGGGFGGFGRGGGGGGFGRGGGFGGGQMHRDGGFGRRGGGMSGDGIGGGRGIGQGRGTGQGGGSGQAGRGVGQGRGTGQGGYGQVGRGPKSGRGPYEAGGRQKVQKPGTYAQRPPQNPPRPTYPGRPPRPTYPRPPIIVHFPTRPVYPILPPVAVAPPVVPRNPTPVYQPPAGPPAIRPVFNAPPPPRQPAAAPPAAAPIVPAATDQGPFVPKEILVTTQAQATPEQIQAFERRLGLTPLSSTRIELLGADLRRYRISDSSTVAATVAGLGGDPAIRLAQPNFLFDLTQGAGPGAPPAAAAAADAAQPERPVQYAIDAMKLDAAQQVSTGAGVLIAVIDSGIDETNPDIAGSIVDRFDAVGGTFEPQAHGTAMAGVIVAHQWLRGIAPQARVLAIRAFTNMGPGMKGNSNDIIRGLDFAASRGAQIVNMSFAGPRDALLAEALMAARTRGMIEIAAAGNAGPDSPPLYPAAETGVIAITATDSQNALFAKANRGAYVAAAAPGVDILAPSTGATMQLTSGTSVAAAEASGVVALLLQGRQNVSADMVRKVLAQTSAPLPGQAGPGNGLIDASAALQAMPPETVIAQPQTAVRFAPASAPAPAGGPAQ